MAAPISTGAVLEEAGLPKIKAIEGYFKPSTAQQSSITISIVKQFLHTSVNKIPELLFSVKLFYYTGFYYTCHVRKSLPRTFPL